MQENRRIQGHLFGAFSVLVWGTTFVSTKVLLRAFTPLEIMVARFTLGFLALLIVGKGLMRPQKRWHEGLFALAGLSGVTLYFLMENIALTYISASLVGVIVAAAPLFTALIAAAVLREKNISLDTWPVGTGPFMMTVFEENRRHEMRRNPSYRVSPYPCEGEPAGARAPAWSHGLPYHSAYLPHFWIWFAVFARSCGD